MPKHQNKIQILLITTILFLFLAYSSDVTLENKDDWNQGSFNATTAENINTENHLTLGYNDEEPGLTGFWRLTQTTEDFSGNNLQTIDTQGIEYKTGILGGESAEFKPSRNSLIEVEDDSALQQENFTVSTWVQTENQDQTKPLINKKSNDNGFEMLVQPFNDKDRLTLKTHDEGETFEFRTEKEVPKNEWVHVAATFNSATGQAVLYINGENQDLETSGSPATFETSTENLFIGTDPNDNHFDGRIDQLRIHQDNLGESEVRQEYFFGTDSVFEGDYSKEITYEDSTALEQAEFESNKTSDTDFSTVFQTLDEGSVVDKQAVEPESGEFTEELDLEISDTYRFVLEGSTTSITETWVLEQLEIGGVQDPDIQVLSLEAENLVEGEESVITAEISEETGLNIEEDVEIRLTLEKLEDGEWKQYLETMKETDLKGGEQKNVIFEEDLKVGPNRLTVEADPEDKITESSTENNTKTITSDIPFYSTVYGDTQKTLQLEGEQTRFLENVDEEPEGNLYYADSDAEFEFSNLQPLEDFEDLKTADEALNSTGFNDSVQSVWGEEESLKRTETFTISGETVEDVPVTDSTKDSPFDTGIVYADSDQGSYAKEDPLVFLTEIQNQEEGEFGVYDYEVKIPSNLETNTGPTETITLYIEIN